MLDLDVTNAVGEIFAKLSGEILLTHHNIKTINNTRRKQLQYITATTGWSIIGLPVLEIRRKFMFMKLRQLNRCNKEYNVQQSST